MSDLYRGMDARAIVVKLQILSGAVVEERCFRAVEATGDASGAFVSTVTDARRTQHLYCRWCTG